MSTYSASTGKNNVANVAASVRGHLFTLMASNTGKVHIVEIELDELGMFDRDTVYKACYGAEGFATSVPLRYLRDEALCSYCAGRIYELFADQTWEAEQARRNVEG